jgi:putative ABC transport system permease protein
VAPWGLIAAVVAGALVVALLAAIMPARRAARLNVIEAVGYE